MSVALHALVPQVFEWTVRILLGCCMLASIRIMRGPRGADRLAALSLISALVLAVLVLYGARADRSFYLDVALIYDIFGFLGILGISSFIREKQEE
ncbi:hypothetical protein AGMMS50268_17430 [Spirochaetia bacterium]|nr:hypothetical protein AGMMS49546_09960 [Spirochaetia bacterium]GHV91240.1 hypothetical protein AGMMS50268_17430 [Spirochaetia bacterium]